MDDDLSTIARKVFASRIVALQDTINMIDIPELEKVVNCLLNANRIELYGLGASAYLAQDAYYRLMKIGLSAYVVADPSIAKVSASRLDEKCVAIGFSHTGRTMELVQIMEIAKSSGAKTICITSYEKTKLTEMCDLKLIIPPCDDRFVVEAVSSRSIQDVVLDCLIICVTIKKYDTAHKNIIDANSLLNLSRF